MQTKPQEWKEKKDTTTKETEFLNRFLVFRVQLVSHFLLLWRFLEDFLTTTDFSVPLRGISSMINCNGYFTTFNHETTQEASQSTECFPLSLLLSHARTALSLSLSLTHARTHTHSQFDTKIALGKKQLIWWAVLLLTPPYEPKLTYKWSNSKHL